MKIDVKGAPGQDLDVVLLDGRRKLAESSESEASRASLRGDLCGVREITVAVPQGVGRRRRLPPRGLTRVTWPAGRDSLRCGK